MVKIAGLHDIKPMVEVFPLAKVNDALEHLKSGKARYRLGIAFQPACMSFVSCHARWGCLHILDGQDLLPGLKHLDERQ